MAQSGMTGGATEAMATGAMPPDAQRDGRSTVMASAATVIVSGRAAAPVRTSGATTDPLVGAEPWTQTGATSTRGDTWSPSIADSSSITTPSIAERLGA